MLYAEARPMQHYSDLVQYDALPTSNVMLLKDGGVLAAWMFVGPDLDAATPEELAALSAHANSAFALLGDGWQGHWDLVHTESSGYPAEGAFPDTTSWLIDEERRLQHQAAGVHYESHTVMSLSYKPTPIIAQTIAGTFIEGEEANTRPNLTTLIQALEQQLNSIVDMLGTRLRMVRLEGKDFLTYLNRGTTGLMHPVAVPAVPVDLDSLLAGQDFVAGFAPQVGEMHIRTVAVTGFPLQSHPTMLSFLNTLPCTYRWNFRFLFLDPFTARAELVRYRKRWSSKVMSIMSQVYEAYSGKPPTYVNDDAREMAKDANDALAVADSGLVRFGFPTTVLVFYHEDPEAATAFAQLAVKELQNHGFPARIERFNTVEAFLGTLPGHGWPNVRRPLIQTMNLADLLPLTSIWPGLETNPSPMFPPDSPALMVASTTGGTPFRLNLHVSDVGMTLILGPIGSGKTTLVNMLIDQWRRYPEAQVFCFTRDFGSQLITHAVGGAHYTFNVDHTVALCPLAQVDNAEERVWAAEWLETVLELQGLSLSPSQRNEIAHALERLAHTELRTLTNFVSTVQDLQIREALHPYTVAGKLGWLLDAEADALGEHRFQTFDLTTLMGAGDRQLIPVLLYLFHYIERRLDGSPTVIPIDEAWMTLMKAVFADKIEEWMRRLRKKNAAVIFISQSVADLARHPKKELILESCQTKIYLANPEALSAHIKPLYNAMGLNDREVEIVGMGRPKRDYYYTSPLGRRLFDLNLGPVALAFAGHGGDEERRVWQTLEAEYPETWQAEWLDHLGHPAEAQQWRERHA